MARELKSFTIEGCYSHLPREILDVLGAPSHVNQGDIYVLARTKKDAAERLSRLLNGPVQPRWIHEGRGNSVEAIASATSFYQDEGDIVALRSSSPSKVAVPRGGQWFLVGETTYQVPGERKFLPKPIFVPVEKPAEPVRITIELDADMDPDLVARLIAGTRCTVGFGRIDHHEVVGKVVQS